MTCDVPKVVPGWIPRWIFCPREKILGIVISWFVNGVEAFTNQATHVVGGTFRSVGGSLEAAGVAAYNGVSGGGAAVLGALRAVQESLVNLAMGLGFGAPIATALAWAFVVALVFAFLRAGTWALKWVT